MLALFRRAANVIARLEDALVFNGYAGYDPDRAGGSAPTPPCPSAHPDVGGTKVRGSSLGGWPSDQSLTIGTYPPARTPLQYYSALLRKATVLVNEVSDAIGLPGKSTATSVRSPWCFRKSCF